jgi:hypothetical protein
MQNLSGCLADFGGSLCAAASCVCATGPSDERDVSLQRRFPEENERGVDGWASAGTRKEATE